MFSIREYLFITTGSLLHGVFHSWIFIYHYRIFVSWCFPFVNICLSLTDLGFWDVFYSWIFVYHYGICVSWCFPFVNICLSLPDLCFVMFSICEYLFITTGSLLRGVFHLRIFIYHYRIFVACCFPFVNICLLLPDLCFVVFSIREYLFITTGSLFCFPWEKSLSPPSW